MNQPKIASFGTWKSPISSESIVAGSVGIGAITMEGENIYWLEGRPLEKGRNVLVKATCKSAPTNQGEIFDITPAPFNVRSRVHEYGGGAFLVVDDFVYFSNFADNRLYKQQIDGNPQPLTAESTRRYADIILDRQRNRLLCVCQEQLETDKEPKNAIASIDLATGKVEILLSGWDFYSSPRLDSQGEYLAWLSWNHPHMPWDSTYLWVARVRADGSIEKPQLIAGSQSESVCEPKWSQYDGKLYFSSDRTDWWNLYCFEPGKKITAIYPLEAEFAYPHWVFGLSTYDFINASQIICTYTQNGGWYLATIDLDKQQLQVIDLPYNNISSLKVKDHYLVFIGSGAKLYSAAVLLNLKTKATQVLKSSTDLNIDSGYLSLPEAIAFPTENNLIAHAWYYKPQNKDYQAPEKELPPLLVKSHGGPTAAASASLNLKVQYWTSRGFAYLDVNYGGSTGYGRKYRQRLQKQWGIVDVDDCVNAAKYLVAQGKVAPEKLAISGGSAGGYTTLAALTFRDTFKAGASYYGISDLTALATDTHKFEARYLDGLVGIYPEEQEIYQKRSPINFTHLLSCPVIFFQGLEDKVVPPNQTEMMVEALKAKGLMVDYVAFPDEQHGFRRGENIKKALDGEFAFYARVFAFDVEGE